MLQQKFLRTTSKTMQMRHAVFRLHKLKIHLAVLLDADVQLKSTSPDPYHLMEMLVYSLINDMKSAETVSL